MMRMAWVVAAKEFRDLLRDRRTIMSMIVIPVLTTPLLVTAIIWLMMRSVDKMKESEISIALLGGSEHAALVTSLETEHTRFAFWSADDAGLPADSLIGMRDTKVVIEIGRGAGNAFELLATSSTEERPSVTLYYDSTDEEAEIAGRELDRSLKRLRDLEVDAWFGERGMSPNLDEPWQLTTHDLASPSQQAASMVARFLPYMVLLLCITGAMYPAMDMTAGEKERSTIETLLVNPVPRSSLVLGKFMATAAMAVGSAIFTVAGQFIFFKWAAGGLSKGMLTLDLELSPLTLAFGLLQMVPVAFFFAALMLALSLIARSMKEAQSYVSPMLALVIFPSMLSMIPGIKLTYSLALIPVVNTSILLKELFLQDVEQWVMVPLVFGINLLYACLALVLAVYVFTREDVVFRS